MRYCLIIAALLASACGQKEKQPRPISEEDVAAELTDLNLDPGRWETRTQIVAVTGPLPRAVVDQLVGRSTSTTACISPEQAERPSATFFAAQQDSECVYRDFKVEGGRLAAEMTCSGGQLPAEMDTRMTGTYASAAYDLTIDMTTGALPGAEVTIRSRSAGRRLGDCS